MINNIVYASYTDEIIPKIEIQHKINDYNCGEGVLHIYFDD